MTAPTGAPPTAPTAPTGTVDKPTKVLPTDRVKFQKQLDLLRAYAAVSGQAMKVANIEAVANVAKLNGSTVSLCNGFFVDVGLLERSPAGGFIPSPEVMAFQRAHAWSPETAAAKLAPLMFQTWFFHRLEPKLIMGPLDRTEAVHDLADAANAHKKYEGQLFLLIDYLEASGVVKRDGETLRLAMDGPPSQEPPMTATPSNGHTPPPSSPSREVRSSPPAGAAPAGVPTPGVHFSIDVSVSMAEIGTWGSDRITAFFSGVAKVLAAKNGTPDPDDTSLDG